MPVFCGGLPRLCSFWDARQREFGITGESVLIGIVDVEAESQLSCVAVL